MAFRNLLFIIAITAVICGVTTIKSGGSNKNAATRNVEKIGSLSWIRTQINNLRKRVGSNVAFQELGILKTYLSGLTTAENSELDEEISELEQLIKENGDWTKLPLESPEVHSDTKSTFSFHPEVKPAVENQDPNVNWENVCEVTAVPVTISQTLLQNEFVQVDNTEAVATGTVHLTVTSTLLLPSTVQVVEIVSVKDSPRVLTSSVLLTRTTYKTVETTLPAAELKTNFVWLSQSQIDVEYAWEAFTTHTPVYVTETSLEVFTNTVPVTIERTYVSTMTVTETEIQQIPETKTMRQSKDFQQWVTETEFAKVMVTYVSTITSISTTSSCYKGFLDGLKPWG